MTEKHKYWACLVLQICTTTCLLIYVHNDNYSRLFFVYAVNEVRCNEVKYSSELWPAKQMLQLHINMLH